MNGKRMPGPLKTCVILLILLVVTASALAHNPKGRKKRLMDWETLRIDDVAYYIEPWVIKGMGDPAVANRFMVTKFKGLEQAGGQVIVRFTVNDHKTGEDFPAELFLERQPDGSWVHVDETGSIIEKSIQTYNRPPLSPMAKGTGMAAGIGLLAGMGAFVIRRRRKNNRSGDIPASQGMFLPEGDLGEREGRQP